MAIGNIYLLSDCTCNVCHAVADQSDMKRMVGPASAASRNFFVGVVII